MAGIPIIAKHFIQLKLYVERWSNPNELPDNIKEVVIEVMGLVTKERIILCQKNNIDTNMIFSPIN
ncbi:TPA: hypothetical protein QCX24_005914 [Bacillus toyonensis]|nr:hypothetical protein [Bacillus toyonensis]